MRILVVSNLYPPYHIGGFEEVCRDVVGELSKRGHELLVLTSTYGVDGPMAEKGIHRKLLLNGILSPSVSTVEFIRRSHQDAAVFNGMIKRFRPSILLFFNMSALAKLLILVGRRSGVPMVYEMADDWAISDYAYDTWSASLNHNPASRVLRFLKFRLIGLIQKTRIASVIKPLFHIRLAPDDFKNAYYRSEYTKQAQSEANLGCEDSPVIHNGLRMADYDRKPTGIAQGFKDFLYVGVVSKRKGVGIAVSAIEHLARLGTHFTLTIIGPSPHAEFLGYLKKRISNLPVTIHARLPRKEIARIYHKYDAFIFPSIREEESCPLVLLEAMASRIPIIGTETGGTREILKDGYNCLTFTSGDASDLVSKMLFLQANPDIRKRLVATAYENVLSDFTLKTSIDRIENHLRDVVGQKR